MHPSQQAKQFILNKFATKFITDDAKSLATRIRNINRNIYHVPFFPKSEAYRNHLVSTVRAMQDVMQDCEQKRKYVVDFSSEIKNLQQKLQEFSQWQNSTAYGYHAGSEGLIKDYTFRYNYRASLLSAPAITNVMPVDSKANQLNFSNDERWGTFWVE